MTLKKKYILIVFVFMLTASLFAQDKTVDSLRIALKIAKHDTEKCNLLNQLIDVTPDGEWENYNEQLLLISNKRLNSKIADGLEKKYINYKTIAINNKGFSAIQSGKPDLALKYFNENLVLLKSTGDKTTLADTYNNIGAIYYNLGNVIVAIDYYQKSLKIFEELNDKKRIGYALNNLGILYYNQGDTAKALDYYEKGLKAKLLIKDKQGIAYSINSIAQIYFFKKNYDKALNYYYKSLKLFEEVKDKRGAALTTNFIGGVYEQQNNITEAQILFKKALETQLLIDDKASIANSKNCIARTYFKQKKYSDAFLYASEALKISKEMGYPKEIFESAFILKQLYFQQKKYTQSLQMYELYIQMQDSISNAETRKATIKSQLKYDYEKKAAADSVKVAEEKKLSALQFKEEENRRYFLYAGLLLTVVFAVFMFSRFRITQKQKNIIEQQKTLVEKQKKLVEEKQKEVMDSIRYAKRIQQSLLPTEKYLERTLNKRS
ncbi:MAG: tetratricopeptide repeat protein [Bacteroidia bacterium]|nr:tetratricopeptide repeat protein [Bacteroidia bacterium]